MNLLIENELRNNYLISLFELSYHLVKITHLPYETDISTFEIQSDVGMVLRNSDANMLGLVNKKLTELKNQGLISKAMKKYGIEHLPPDF